MQLEFLVVSYDNCAMWITQDDLCSHVYQLVNEEQSAFKHLLMYQDASFGLCCNNQQYTQKIGCQSWPRSIGNSHERAVQE